MFQMITQSGHVPDTFLPYAETGAANIWPLPAIRYTLGWTAKYGKQRTVAHLYSRHAKADSLPSPDSVPASLVTTQQMAVHNGGVAGREENMIEMHPEIERFTSRYEVE